MPTNSAKSRQSRDTPSSPEGGKANGLSKGRRQHKAQIGGLLGRTYFVPVV